MPFHPDDPSLGDHSWWASGGRPIVSLIMFAIVIGVIVWGVLRSTTSRNPTGTATVSAGRADGALEEVRVRYARGEMSREEFVQRFRDLGGTGVDAVPLPTEPTPPAV